MSPEASERLKKWLNWLPNFPSEDEWQEADRRWEQGIDPPKEPYSKNWHKK